jgi:VanZ family protein
MTSARNLCTLAWNAMQNATFRQYVQTRRREADWQDVVADMAGALLGLAVVALTRRFASKR